jgi:uncharacterized protein YjbJ (UPF0337 family)
VIDVAEQLTWTMDEIRGKADPVKAAVKKGVGNLLQDEQLRHAREADEAAVRAEERIGRSVERLEAIKDVGYKLGH